MCASCPNNTFTVYAYFPNGRHQARKEYLIYNFDSLIADVGGYLGLLLGHSVLSLFYTAESGMKTLKSVFT